MLINGLAEKAALDAENVVVKGAAVVLFAGAVCIVNELWSWQLSLISLLVISTVAGSIGFVTASAFPLLIKALPVAVVCYFAAFAGKDVVRHFYFELVHIKPFLAQTDNCKALGLELVNKHNYGACVARASKTIQQNCLRVTDNEWSCRIVNVADVVAAPEQNANPIFNP